MVNEEKDKKPLVKLKTSRVKEQRSNSLGSITYTTSEISEIIGTQNLEINKQTHWSYKRTPKSLTIRKKKTMMMSLLRRASYPEVHLRKKMETNVHGRRPALSMITLRNDNAKTGSTPGIHPNLRENIS